MILTILEIIIFIVAFSIYMFIKIDYISDVIVLLLLAIMLGLLTALYVIIEVNSVSIINHEILFMINNNSSSMQ
jgi:hypothetical protein